MIKVAVRFKDKKLYSNPLFLHQLRGISDNFAKPGIMAKHGQKNIVISKNQCFTTKWPSKKMAIDYMKVVENHCGDAVVVNLVSGRLRAKFQTAKKPFRYCYRSASSLAKGKGKPPSSVPRHPSSMSK